MGTKTDNTTKTKALGTFSIWAIGVGMVISGESFGWNIGWSITGPVGFFIPVAFTALLYFALVKCLIELACVYPSAEGPHTYMGLAYGRRWGSLISLAILFEFLFATPAIANSIGEYISFLSNTPEHTQLIATAFIAAFSVINLFNVSISVRFLIALTVLAIAELMIYESAVVTEFSIASLSNPPYQDLSLAALTKALPFAIWLLLAIEGISLMTQHVSTTNFRKTITRGYLSSYWTLLLLALSVLTLAAAGIHWTAANWQIISNDNHPMPASLAIILSRNNIIVRVFTFIGLFGLIASLQGVALAATTQLAHFLPDSAATTRWRKPIAAFIVFTISMAAIWSSQTSFLIELSVFGAVIMYFGVGVSLYQLRRKERAGQASKDGYRHKDFSGGRSVFFAMITSVFSAICLLSLCISSPQTFVIFATICILFLLGRQARKRANRQTR